MPVPNKKSTATYSQKYAETQQKKQQQAQPQPAIKKSSKATIDASKKPSNQSSAAVKVKPAAPVSYEQDFDDYQEQPQKKPSQDEYQDDFDDYQVEDDFESFDEEDDDDDQRSGNEKSNAQLNLDSKVVDSGKELSVKAVGGLNSSNAVKEVSERPSEILKPTPYQKIPTESRAFKDALLKNETPNAIAEPLVKTSATIMTSRSPVEIKTSVPLKSASRKPAVHPALIKEQQRYLQLKKVIELGLSTTITLLDLSPRSEYTVFMQRIGAAGNDVGDGAIAHCGTQRPDSEDTMDQQMMTDRFDVDHKYIQAGDGWEYMDTSLGPDEGFQRLQYFLKWSSKIMSEVLNDNDELSGHNEAVIEEDLSVEQNLIGWSDRFQQLDTKLFAGRTIQFVSLKVPFILIGYSASSKAVHGSRWDSKPMLAIYHKLRLEKILFCMQEMTSVAWSPVSMNHVVTAGCVDGSLVLWDLQSQESLQKDRFQFLSKDLQLFDPCYTLLQTSSNQPGHFDSIVSVTMFHPHGDHGLIQLASADKTGKVFFWVLIELLDADVSDPAVWPSGRYRLQPIHSISACSLSGLNNMFLDFSDPSRVFLLPETGDLLSRTWTGMQAGCTQTYRLHYLDANHLNSETFNRPADISISTLMPLILVGYPTGDVLVYHRNDTVPCLQFILKFPVKRVQWSLQRPSVFFVQTMNGIHVWDLAHQPLGPLRFIELKASSSKSDYLWSFDQKMNILAEQNSGVVQVHWLSDTWTQSEPDELGITKKILYI